MNFEYKVELSEDEYEALKRTAEALVEYAKARASGSPDPTTINSIVATLNADQSKVSGAASDAAVLLEDHRQLGLSKGPGPTNPNGGHEGTLVAENSGGGASNGYTVNININLPRP